MKLSPKCTNVAIGHVLESLNKLDKSVYKRNDVKKFIKRQTKNTRPKVKKIAEELLINFK